MERNEVMSDLKRLVRAVHADWGPSLREAIRLLGLAPEPPAAAQGPSREELLKLTTDFLADKPDASALQLAVVLFLDGNVTEADIAATRKWLADEASKQGGKT